MMMMEMKAKLSILLNSLKLYVSIQVPLSDSSALPALRSCVVRVVGFGSRGLPNPTTRTTQLRAAAGARSHEAT